MNGADDETPPKCPRCNDPLPDRPALSRRDGATHICSRCGHEEALIDCGLEGSVLLVMGIMQREHRFALIRARRQVEGQLAAALADTDHKNPTDEEDPAFWDYAGWEADRRTIVAMLRFGGSFVQALGRAAECADRENLAKIKAVWPDFWTKYSEAHWLREKGDPR